MKRCCLDSLRYAPLHSSRENVGVIVIHSEHEAAVDHHAETMESSHSVLVVEPDVLHLPLPAQISDVRGFKSDKQAAKTAVDRLLQESWLMHGIHCSCSLPQPAHAFHSVEEGCRKLRISEEVIIKEVKMPAGKPLDFSESGIYGLCIKGAAASEERFLITEVAHIRAAS